MAHKITPTKVVTVTKDGECHLVITLELNINLNSNQGMSAEIKSYDRAEVDDDNVSFEIPDFSSMKLENFGKVE